MKNDNELTQRILTYLQERQQAGDTLEGIATWWVQRQQVSESVKAVHNALQELEAEGVVIERKIPNGRTLYLLRDDQ
ncbi:MAG TPA: hypothetical protein VIQ24_08030 [Pyrinomonadaceae bacterium]